MNRRTRFAEAMATPAGRFARIAAGIVLMVVGYFVGGVAGVVLALVGLVPVVAGATDVCFVAPLLHVPFRGRDLEAAHAART